MAKKSRRGGGSAGNEGSGPQRGAKPAAIRDYLKAHKGALPKQVVAAMKNKGVNVSPNMVSIIRAKAGVKKARRKAKQAAADQDSSAGIKLHQAEALEAALTLYKAAMGMDTQGAKIRESFLLLVGVLG